jgi:hypothetical protein
LRDGEVPPRAEHECNLSSSPFPKLGRRTSL